MTDWTETVDHINLIWSTVSVQSVIPQYNKG